MIPMFVKLGDRYLALRSISLIEPHREAPYGSIRLGDGEEFLLTQDEWATLLTYLEAQTETGLVIDLNRLATARQAQREAA